MKKILESRIVLVIVTIILSTIVSVIADNVITSNSVSYSNSKTSETTVNGALDELFESVKINEELVVIKDRLNQIESSYLTVNETYPIGSIYISTRNTNPATIFAGTTWTAFGTGRTLVGVNTSNTNFSTVEKTGGSSNVTLTTAQLPSHTHGIPALSGTTSNTGAHTHYTANSTGQSSDSTTSNMQTGAIAHQNNGGSTIQYFGLQYSLAFGGTANSGLTSSNGAHSHNVSTTASTSGTTGSGSTVSVQNPYITVYMWKRTA